LIVGVGDEDGERVDDDERGTHKEGLGERDFDLDLALGAACFRVGAAHEEFAGGNLHELESDFVAEIEAQFFGSGCR